MSTEQELRPGSVWTHRTGKYPAVTIVKTYESPLYGAMVKYGAANSAQSCSVTYFLHRYVLGVQVKP